MRLRFATLSLTCLAAVVLHVTEPIAQQPAPPTVIDVRAIDAGEVALPPESATALDTKFSFFAYGDTRGAADGIELQSAHRDLIERMLATIPVEQRAGFPVRFVVQSGDAVTDGRYGAQWNTSFTPLVERLIHEGRVPYLFAVGNHDVGGMPAGSPERNEGLRNAAAAMAHLWPPNGSTRRLNDYPTFAFGYGRYFFLLFDSNIPTDPVQFAWVEAQLEGLDRQRFPHVVAVFHHPLLTTGPHGGPQVERQTEELRRAYLPLFRAHHVRLTITGHDHLFDHFVERYEDETGTHRMDHVVSGGGGAPVYAYRGEQDLAAYAAAAPGRTRVEHIVRPSVREADNPHHFVVFEVDGDRLWIQVIAISASPFLPYGQPRVELADR